MSNSNVPEGRESIDKSFPSPVEDIRSFSTGYDHRSEFEVLEVVIHDGEGIPQVVGDTLIFFHSQHYHQYNSLLWKIDQFAFGIGSLLFDSTVIKLIPIYLTRFP